MAVSINNISNINAQPKVPFKGKWDKTEQGNPYYKTNSGMVAGGVLAVPAALMHLSKLSAPTTEEGVRSQVDKVKNFFTKGLDPQDAKDITKEFDKQMKLSSDEISKVVKQNKLLKNLAVPFALIAAGATIGCGIYVDNKRNEKAKEAADLTRQVGVKNAVLQGDNLAISNKGKVYYDSNVGAKNGAMLGAACGVAHGLMSTVGKFNVSAPIFGALIFALGGWMMGKIADSNTNKDARRNA